MPETTCCVPGCSLKGRHVFPCDVSRRKTWVHAIKRRKTSMKAGHRRNTCTSVKITSQPTTTIHLPMTVKELECIRNKSNFVFDLVYFHTVNELCKCLKCLVNPFNVCNTCYRPSYQIFNLTSWQYVVIYMYIHRRKRERDRVMIKGVEIGFFSKTQNYLIHKYLR